MLLSSPSVDFSIFFWLLLLSLTCLFLLSFFRAQPPQPNLGRTRRLLGRSLSYFSRFLISLQPDPDDDDDVSYQRARLRYFWMLVLRLYGAAASRGLGDPFDTHALELYWLSRFFQDFTRYGAFCWASWAILSAIFGVPYDLMSVFLSTGAFWSVCALFSGRRY